METGIVFNIQRFTVHDGPGIRTEIFLKGCPLSCRWCSNPESQKPEPEPGVYPVKCIGRKACGLCQAERIRPDAIVFSADDKIKKIRWNEEEKSQHGKIEELSERLVHSCPADAIKQWGRRYDTEELMEIICRDRSFYESSGGGVTVSGGEPLLQASFVKELFEKCHAQGIHTCLETTLFGRWDVIRSLLPQTDCLITDIKQMDPEKHRMGTGVGNEEILANLEAVVRSYEGSQITIRLPIIPGFNDDTENITATVQFIKERLGGNIKEVELLRFMHLGEEKYRSLGRPYLMSHISPQPEEFLQDILDIQEYIAGNGIACRIHGSGDE